MADATCAECRRDRRIYARGMCNPCYKLLRQTGQLDRHPRVRQAVPSVLWVPPGVNAVSGLSLSAINAAKIVGDCGHPFDYVRPDGARGCRRCRTAAVARWRARQR